jgi:glycosyltransferase involved in cell wall biosynthesis
MTLLSLVIPVYNEVKRVEFLHETLLQFRNVFISTFPGEQFELLLIDDGSKDRTLELLKHLESKIAEVSDITPKILIHEKNRGKGAALKTGILAASGRWILTLDADMATSPTQLILWHQEGLIDLTARTENVIFAGSREHENSDVEDTKLRRFVGRIFNLLVQSLASIYIDDTQCGFKLYPSNTARGLFNKLKNNGWAHDVELLRRAQMSGTSIVALPIRWRAKDDSKINIATDSIKMLFALLTIRLRLDFEAFLDFRRVFRRNGLPGERWTSLSYYLFLLCLFLMIFTFRDYGITYDELWQATYGDHVIRWYTSFFSDQGALTYWNMSNYGGFFDAIAQVATKFSPIGIFETRHLVNALFGLIGVMAAYKLGKYFGGPMAGFLSALFLLLTPRFYGHAFNNSKDIPFLAFYLVSLYYIIRSVRFLPQIPKGLVVKLGFAIGLTLGIRVGGILLLAYLALAFILWMATQNHTSRDPTSKPLDLTSAFRTFSLRYLGVCVIAYLTMLLWWPAAQMRPIVQPAKALLHATRFNYSFNVFFQGMIQSNKDLPWYYASKWFLITLPEFYFVSFAIGLVLLAVSVRSFQISFRTKENFIEYSLLFLSSLFPLFYAAISGAVVYDCLRHFLFIIPVLAVFAALSVVRFFNRFSSSFSSAAVFAVILALSVLTISDMWQLHPHQYIYFNRLVGKGVAEAAKSYETDYWGNSYKEGVQWIVKNYKGRVPGKKIKVASCLHSFSTTYFLPPDRFEYIGSFDGGRLIVDGEKPDVFLATARWGCHNKLNGNVLHIIERKGARLLYIIEVSNGPQS